MNHEAIETDGTAPSSIDSPEASFVATEGGTITSWNAAAERLFGIPASEAIGRRCCTVLRERAPDQESICHTFCGPPWQNGAADLISPVHLVVQQLGTGRELSLAFHIAVLADSSGQPVKLLHVVEDVGERLRKERIADRFLSLVGKPEELEVELTVREREVCALLLEGLTAKEIGRRLGIHHTTARNHVQHILTKLNVQSRLAALTRIMASLVLEDVD